MAKDVFAEGDAVRLTRKLEFGNVKLAPNTKGKIRRITKKLFGANEYAVRWAGTNFDITMTGTSQFALAQTMDGDVYKS